MNDKNSTHVGRTLRSQWLILLLLALVLLAFNFDALTVRITEINYWDEANYIIRGRALTQGTLPEFSWSPLTTSFFALLYLPFASQGNWLPAVASIGRVIIFLLSFLSLYLVAREVKLVPWPAAVFGVALVYPAMVSMLKFQSDALFAVLSGFALWQLLRYRNTLKEASIWYASSFLGLAALTRNDGLILFGVFLLIVLIVIKNGGVPLKRKLTAGIAPFFGLLLGYLLIYAAVTGDFYLGTKQRTWVAFMQGQYFIYGDDHTCEGAQLACALEQAEELYGSAEENNYSVLSAIAGSPGAYAGRLFQMLKKLPGIAYRAYGGQTAFSLVLFGALGVIRLLRGRQKELLLILGGWMLYLLVYLLTFYRPGYFYLPFVIFYVLGLLGVFELVELFLKRKPRLILTCLLVGITAVGLLAELGPVYLTGGLILASLWIGWGLTAALKLEGKPFAQALPLILLLAAGVFLHGGYDLISFERSAPLAEEEAILTLFSDYPQDTLVAAGAPGAVVSAQMSFVPLAGLDSDSPEALYHSMLSAGVEAIYVDHHLSNVRAQEWAMIEPQIGGWYSLVYASADGSILVLAVEPGP
ncbi:MAG: hypothetical protein ABFS17_13170 [Chloroflexota bacterium]